MRSTEAGSVIGLLLIVTACGSTSPGPATSEPAARASTSRAAASPVSTAPSATTSPTPSATPDAAGLDLPEPGRPFDGSTLLREMQSSTRPDGVPDAVKTFRVAEALAERLWSFDGSTWDTFAIGGHCGSGVCTLDIAGTRIGSAGEDLWVLEVDPSAAAVQVVSAELRALPWDVVDRLDALARTADPDGDLEPMILATARWLPPPDGDRFVLSYRSGGEEGSCRRDVTVDAARGVVLDATSSGC